jgi:hypothetical protein
MKTNEESIDRMIQHLNGQRRRFDILDSIDEEIVERVIQRELVRRWRTVEPLRYGYVHDEHDEQQDLFDEDGDTE